MRSTKNQKRYEKGRDWASAASSSPDRLQLSADRKLWAGGAFNRRETSMPVWDRAFWQGVWDWSTEKIYEDREPAAWEKARRFVLAWIADNDEMDKIDEEFAQHKNKLVPLTAVLTQLAGEGLIVRQRGRVRAPD